MPIPIKIIKARGGITTSEQLLNLLAAYPQGLMMKELVNEINRSPSMLLIVLKELMARKFEKGSAFEEYL